jgi:hypothetical protein
MQFPSYITALISIVGSVTESASKLEQSMNCTENPYTSFCLGLELIYLNEVCAPPTSNTSLDLTFPCNQNNVLYNECVFGRTFAEVWNTTSGEWVKDLGEGWTQQSIGNQRLCACESQFFPTLVGCTECWQAHGSNVEAFNATAASSISSSYCAASATPTVGLEKVMAAFYNGSAADALSGGDAKATYSVSAFSDPLKGSTAVSYYYTPSVTGTAVFGIAGITKGAEATETSVRHGQITSGAGHLEPGMDWVPIKLAGAAIVGLGVLVTML